MSETIYLRARRHLARRDPVMKRLMAAVGPCTLRPNPDSFGLLVRSIIAQQISTRAAETIGARLRTAVGPDGLTPRAILGLSDEAMRGAGLSAGKMRALRDLAEKVHTGQVPLDRLPAMDDEEVITALVPVRGIGRWTAQMFLIFSLGRLDVLPVDDLGLKAGVKASYGLAELPNKHELHEIAAPWRPYASIATWYIWRSKDTPRT